METEGSGQLQVTMYVRRHQVSCVIGLQVGVGPPPTTFWCLHRLVEAFDDPGNWTLTDVVAVELAPKGLPKFCLFILFSLTSLLLAFIHITMADEQVPVHYEDLALLETKFDEVDRQICTQFLFAPS